MKERVRTWREQEKEMNKTTRPRCEQPYTQPCTPPGYPEPPKNSPLHRSNPRSPSRQPQEASRRGETAAPHHPATASPLARQLQRSQLGHVAARLTMGGDGFLGYVKAEARAQGQVSGGKTAFMQTGEDRLEALHTVKFFGGPGESADWSEMTTADQERHLRCRSSRGHRRRFTHPHL